MIAHRRHLHAVPLGTTSRPVSGVNASRARISRVVARLASALNTLAARFDPGDVCSCRLVDTHEDYCPRCGR